MITISTRNADQVNQFNTPPTVCHTPWTLGWSSSSVGMTSAATSSIGASNQRRQRSAFSSLRSKFTRSRSTEQAGLLQMDAARDLDPLAREPVVLGTQQGGDRGADVVGDRDPAERRERGDVLADLGVVADEAVAEVGGDRAGGDHVRGDAPRAELDRHVAGERLDGGLDRTVGRALWARETSEAAREVDDRAAVGDQRQQRLREEERALEVDGEERVDVFFADVGDHPAARVARVVDEVVER